MSRSKVKVMLVVFFDWKGIVHHGFVPRGQMVNKQSYQEVLARLRDAVRRKRPELWENQTWMWHHDMRRLTRRSSSAVIWQNLVPADFFLFPKLKTIERTSFPNYTGDSGKCHKRTARHHRKCVPGSIPAMEEKLGAVYRQ